MPRGAPEQLELELNRRKPCSSGKRAAASADAERLLELPDALLTRSHLRALGLERRAIDAVFSRVLPRMGNAAVAEIDAQSVAALVADLHAAGLKKQTIRKTVSVL